VQTFVRDSGKLFTELKENIETIAGAVKGLAEIIKATTSPVEYARDKYNELRDSYDEAGDAADKAGPKIDRTGRAATKVNTSLDQTAGAGNRAADAIEDTGTAAEEAVPGLDKLGNVIPIVSAAQTEAEEKTRLINETLKVQQQVAQQTGTNIEDLAGKINYLGKQYNLLSTEKGLAEQNDANDKRIKEATAKTFAEIQQRIQANIDASKELAGAFEDVGDAAEQSAEQVEGFRSQLDEDLSSAIFQGLSEGIARTAAGLALIEGVSESAIRDKLQSATRGAINEFKGLNDQIRRFDDLMRTADGAAMFARATRELEAYNEKIATATERTREFAQAQRDLTAELQRRADDRNLSEAEQEQRRFDEEMARIEEYAKRRGFLGAADAALQRKLAADEHAARMREINEQATERVRAEADADEQIAGRRKAGQGGVQAKGEGSTGTTAGAAAGPPITYSTTINIPPGTLVTQGAADEIVRLLAPAQERMARRSR